MLLILLFILGICFGSFLNVVIDRIPQKKSIFFPRSHCEKCHKKIAFYDLIPLVSFLVLQGKCRYCKARIGIRTFIIELLSGLLFIIIFLLGFNLMQYIFISAIGLIILAIAVIDAEHGVIPDKLLLMLGSISFVYIILSGSNSFLSHISTAVISFLFFVLIFLITRGRGIGFGDVKYSFFIGFLLSFAQLVIAFYLAFLTGAFISIILIIGGRKKLRGDVIAFGPF